MAGRGKLVEGLLGGPERGLGFVEPILLQERAAEHELRVADLVDEVDAVSEELESVTRLLLCARRITGAQMDLRQ